MQRYVYRRPFDFGRRLKLPVILVDAVVAPLSLPDYPDVENVSPYETDEEVVTVEATGGTPPYSYAITSQTLL